MHNAGMLNVHEFKAQDLHGLSFGAPPRVRLVAAPMIADDPHWSVIHDNKSTFN